MKALIVVDMQNDFIEGGALEVKGGLSIIPGIQKLLKDYDLVVSTQDWHIEPGAHFSETPDYVDSWPEHCVAGTYGAELVSPLNKTFKRKEVLAVYKGQYEATYSGFEGKTEEGYLLNEILENFEITAVDVIGLATDYCVYETAKDAAELGYKTRVLTKYTAGINIKKVEETRRELEGMGVEYV